MMASKSLLLLEALVSFPHNPHLHLGLQDVLLKHCRMAMMLPAEFLCASHILSNFGHPGRAKDPRMMSSMARVSNRISAVVARDRPWYHFCCTVHFSGGSLTTSRVDGAGFRNVMKVPSQCSYLCSRVPASVRPADARLSRGQWYRAALCVSVCELAVLALELDLACEVVSKLCFCSRICI